MMGSEKIPKYVRMPWEDNTTIIYGDEIYCKWNLVIKLLESHIPDVDTLISVIRSYNVEFSEDGVQSTVPWSFKALRQVVESMDDNQRINFFAENGVLNSIRKLTLLLPDTCSKLIILQIGVENSVTLHQMQVASILANAFFCTFPKRGRLEPLINFNSLFEGHCQSNARHVEKLKCLIHYFERIHDKQPNGYITFQRRCTEEGQYPRWDRTPVKLCSLTVDDAGRIEDQAGHLQMDFANRTLGGGVLGWGCVQEEIRFVICPELIAARLFIEPMTDNEAFLIIGAERYCNYSGYADNFQYAGDHRDQTPFDKDQRRSVHILAVDAVNFRQPTDQYRESRILREIKKIYTGLALRTGDDVLTLATGNWGCGAYRGDPELKSLLQVMAASQAGRNVAYFTFGNQELKVQLTRTHAKLKQLDVTVGLLYKVLRQYIKDRRSKQTVFQFVVATAHKYVNAYAMARNPSDNRPTPLEGSESGPSTTGQIDSKDFYKISRNNLPPWPRQWLEKEKPKPMIDRPPEIPHSSDADSEMTNPDDFIPATPEEERPNNFFRASTGNKHDSPVVSLLDALEADENRCDTETDTEKVISILDKRESSGDRAVLPDEKMYGTTTSAPRPTPLSLPKLDSGKKVEKKFSQPRIDCFLKK